MVTRTVRGTLVTVMVVNTESAEVRNETFVIPKVYKKEKALKEAIQKHLELFCKKDKLVDICDKKTIDTLKGMTDEEFDRYAVELDPKTRRPLTSGLAETSESK